MAVGVRTESPISRSGVCLILVALTAFVFAQTRQFTFLTFDDALYVTQNTHVRSGLTWATVPWAVRASVAGNWHPLTLLSHAFDSTLFGLAPAGPHLVNAALHAVNAVLLFLLLAAATGEILPSAVTAALFALHPLHVESVAWISERKDVLSTLFWLLSLGAWGYYTRQPSARRLATALIAFGCALLAKPMAVTLPLTLLCIDIWPLQRMGAVRPGRLMVEKIPFFVLSFAGALLSVFTQRDAGALMDPAAFPLLRFANAVFTYVWYLGKAVWPYGLACFYPHPGATLSLWKAGASALFMATATVRAWRARTKQPYVLAAWLWYVLTLVPVIGILQVGGQGMADRYTYVPLMGPFAAAAWASSRGLSRRASGAFACGWILVLGCFAMLARMQAATWRDDVSLFSQAVAARPDNGLAYNNLAQALYREGRVGEARRNLELALRITPPRADTHNNLGLLLLSTGELTEAISHLRLAVDIEPRNPQAHRNLGDALFRQGKRNEAIFHLREALRIAPDYTNASTLLGEVLRSPGR